MGTYKNNTKIHWNYYLAIEQDFELISRFIEFSEENYNTFSIELARIIMTASQEIDVVLKRICMLVNKDSNAKNINGYREIIKRTYPDLIDEEVRIPRFGIECKPWSEWNENESLVWWRANNDIKHQRNKNFEKANLKNAFNALAGLLIVNIYYYKKELENEINEPVPFKKVTNQLHSVNNFLKLKDCYYVKSLGI